MRYNPRALFLAGLGLAALAVTLCLPPIHQWNNYHDFADARGFLGLPNALNVLSNLPFLVVGILGLRFLARPPAGAFREPWERGPVAVLMVAFLLVGLGSSLYHWHPNDRTLFWDRLPLAILFSSFLAATVIERVSLRWGAILFFPLVASGVAGVIYWYWTNAAGPGDLRFYLLMQAGSVLAIPLMVLLFPPRYTGGRDLLVVIALYGLAKVFEILDGPVYHAGHLLSGHTLKHLLGALAAWVFLRMIRRRQTLVAPARQA